MNDEESTPDNDPLQSDLAPCEYEYLEESDSVLFEEYTTVRKRRKVATPPPPPASRHRVYPDDFGGPWVVYFRPIEKSLNVMRIQEDLAKYFPAVTEIRKIRPNRLRVEVNDRKQANDIVRFELFTRQYRVYIPARDVEIDGVVTEGSLTCDDLLDRGVGCFKNSSLKHVKVIDCRQLSSATQTEDKKKYTRSDSFKVTFEGSALPDFVSIGKVRLPVRLFVHRVMTCLNCKQFGHTATHCSSKAKCGKCGEMHADDGCDKHAEKCVYCGESPHDLSACPMYKMREEKLKRSTKARSQRSYAELLRNATAASTPNPFQILSDSSDEDEKNEGCSVSQTKPAQRRKLTTPLSPLRPSKGRSTSRARTQKSLSSAGNSLASIDSRQYDSEFPALPGPSKTATKSSSAVTNVKNKPTLVTQTHQAPESGLFSFEVLVEWILGALSIPEHLRTFIDPLLPKLKDFLKKLSVKWPILSVIVSFDG